MNYSEFLKRSKRSDVGVNNKLHFFSSTLSPITAYMLYKAGMSANGATALFGLMGIASAVMFYLEFFLAGYLLFRLHIIIDMADGAIARAKQQFSQYADGYDKINHILINVSVILALSKNNDDYSVMILLPIFLVYYLFSKLFVIYPKGVHAGSASLKKVIAKNILSFEGYILLMCLNSICDAVSPDSINILYASFFVSLIFLKFRHMKRNETA